MYGGSVLSALDIDKFGDGPKWPDGPEMISETSVRKKKKDPWLLRVITGGMGSKP